MKKPVRNVLIILGIVLVLFVTAAISVNITKNWIATVTWENPKIDQLPDGDYPGEVQLQLPAGMAAASSGAKVVVHVRGHQYSGIDVIDPDPLAKAMEPLSLKVVEEQSLVLPPDAMAGGTVTKVAFLSAASNAVKEALTKTAQ